MSIKSNIIEFPDKIKKIQEEKKKKYNHIRDSVENLLKNYSNFYEDEWAVVLAAGRFASMRLQQIEGSESSIEFFRKCIETQEGKEINL